MKQTRSLRWIPALFLMVVIFLFSHQPGGDSGELTRIILNWLAEQGIDFRAWFGENAGIVLRKTAHFCEYGLLCLLLYFPLSAYTKWPRSGLLAWLFAVLYAASDEFHQLFIPKRVGNLMDVGIDGLGALAAFGLIALLRLLFLRRKTKT